MEELLANIIKEADYSKLPALKISAQDALGKNYYSIFSHNMIQVLLVLVSNNYYVMRLAQFNSINVSFLNLLTKFNVFN